jgi:hypothetical protein
MRLCDAAFGTLRTTQDGEHFDLAALGRVPPALAEYLEHDSPTIGSGRGPARILEGERVVHVLDAAADDTYRSAPPGRRALVDLGGARTVLSVGMRKDDVVLGVITIYRQEVRPFSVLRFYQGLDLPARLTIRFERDRGFADSPLEEAVMSELVSGLEKRICREFRSIRLLRGTSVARKGERSQMLTGPIP